MGFCDDRVTTKKIISDQLSCCLLDNIKYNCTTNNLFNCYDLGDSLTNPNSTSGFLVQCHTIKNINACVSREKNEPARDICDRKDSLYCLGGGARLDAVKQGLSSQILPAYAWALNRTLYQDSLSGIKACYNETEGAFKTCPNFPDEQIYELWNSTLDCKDFFQLGETNDCLLRDKKNIILPNFNMTIIKQVCKDPNWVNTTIEGVLGTSDKISLGVGLGVGVPGFIVATIGVWFAFKQMRKVTNRETVQTVQNTNQNSEISNDNSSSKDSQIEVSPNNQQNNNDEEEIEMSVFDSDRAIKKYWKDLEKKK